MKNNLNQKDHFNDLCVTCKNNSSCMYIKNGHRPVQRCEEFEVYSYRPVIQKIPTLKRKVVKDNPSFLGICKNCDNRKTCMNAKPDRVIWHCEEYV